MLTTRCLSAFSLAVMIAMIGPSLCGGAPLVVETDDAAPQYNLYFGDLHSHTSYSDGDGTPDEAFEAAQAAGADFLAITDHHYLLRDVEWADTLRSADAHSSSAFAAIAAYEYFVPGINELNIYGIPYMPPDASQFRPSGVFPWIYDWIAGEPGAVGQWNHPLSYGYPDAWDYFQFDFLTEERDLAMGMIECYNGNIRESSYIKALDAGWHMMPTATADTHSADWISGSEVRTVLLAPSLGREDLYDAMRDGRGYATLDSNLRILYTLNGAAMGSVLSGGPSFVANIHIEDPDGPASDAITLVEIVSDGGNVVASMPGDGSAAFDWTVTLTSEDASYYFVRVYTGSNELGIPGVTAWTAPVWTGA